MVLNWLIQRLSTYLWPILVLYNPWNTRKHLGFFHLTYFHIKISARANEAENTRYFISIVFLFLVFLWGRGQSQSMPMIFLRGHPLSAYAKFPEKLTFLTPWYAHVPVLTRGLEMLVFGKFCVFTSWMAPYFSRILCLEYAWSSRIYIKVGT